MTDIIHKLVIMYNQFKTILSPELLTIVVLFLMIARKSVVTISCICIAKLFKITVTEDLKKSWGYLSAYVLLSGIIALIHIWSKNVRVLETTYVLFRIITILTIAKTISFAVLPESTFFKSLSQKQNSILINRFISNVLKIGIYIVATFIIITELGYNINGLVAGLGIGSAIIALAVQDIFKSIISGASIIAEKPFTIGDWIEMENFGGTVEDITLRNTRIRMKDNTVMNIPNSKITSECVKNYNEIDNRRIELEFYLDYAIEVEKIRRIVNKTKTIIENNPKVLEGTPTVTIDGIGKDGLRVYIYFYIKDNKYQRYLEIKEKTSLQILEMLKTENIRPMYGVLQIVEEEKHIENEPKKHIEVDE